MASQRDFSYYASVLIPPEAGEFCDEFLYMVFTQYELYGDQISCGLMPREKGLAMDWFGKSCLPASPKAALWSFEGAMLAVMTRMVTRDPDGRAALIAYTRETYTLCRLWAGQAIASLPLSTATVKRSNIDKPDPDPHCEGGHERMRNRMNWVMNWAHSPLTPVEQIKLLMQNARDDAEWHLEHQIRGKL